MTEQMVIPGIDFDAIKSPDGIKYVQHKDWLVPVRPKRSRKVTTGPPQATLWSNMAQR